MTLTRRTVTSLLALAATLGCGGTQFGGAKTSSGKAPATVHDRFAYAAATPCTGATPLAMSGNTPFSLTVTGDLCPTPTTEGLNIAFLVDISYSMRTIDPQLEGSCGRLVAAKALVAHLQTLVADDTKLRLGVVHFSDTGTIKVADLPLSRAAELTTVEQFCATEIESSGFTNYKVAFDLLPKLARDSDIARLAYLITDGVPTAGGDAGSGFVEDVAESKRRLDVHGAAAKAGLAAANVGGDQKPWTLDALFLGDKADFVAYDFDPEAFLAELTGDAARVAVTTEAIGLSTAIVALPLGTPGVDVATAVASLVPAVGDPMSLTIAGISASGLAGRWTFTLATLAGDSLSPGAYEVVVTAKDVLGRPLETRHQVTVAP